MIMIDNRGAAITSAEVTETEKNINRNRKILNKVSSHVINIIDINKRMIYIH